MSDDTDQPVKELTEGKSGKVKRTYLPNPKRRPIVLDRSNVKERETVIVRPKGVGIDLPPYKDAAGRWRTKSLFHETFNWMEEDKDGDKMVERMTPIFTLREFPLVLGDASPFKARYVDGIIPSLRELYLSYDDPTEYKFSMEVLKSNFHWKHLLTFDWFKLYVEEWRLTLAEKLRSTGIEAMVRIAKGSDPKLALNAARWLAEEGFGQRRAKGRPSEQSVVTEVKREAQIEKIYSEDAARLGIPTERPVETFSITSSTPDTKQ